MIRLAHRLSAVPIGAFLVLHTTNHWVGVIGQQEHVQFMRAIRPLYRNVIVEPLLLLLLLWQIASGMRLLVARIRAADGVVAWAQMGSGAYLAMFIGVHVASVLVAKDLHGTDTDFGFAAAGLHSPASSWFFAPYYAGSMVALFTHIACALSWAIYPDRNGARICWVAGAAALGLVGGVLIVLALGGTFYEVVLRS